MQERNNPVTNENGMSCGQPSGTSKKRSLSVVDLSDCETEDEHADQNRSKIILSVKMEKDDWFYLIMDSHYFILFPVKQFNYKQ